ncbi:hypothetical protein BZA70DRAFT_306977 [Myxozyma melibiosi]|uniref:Uncharacterized protein n=1 Tax=Myxozyma melibiosi TaxID=54550 RepID=A0ABR1F6V1_9ASCO
MPLADLNNAGRRGLADLEKSSSETNSVCEPGKPCKFLVDWNGPNDPENPHNWSTFKKSFVMFEICLITFTIYIGCSIYSPGVDQIMHDFDVGFVVAMLPLSLYVVGYGISPMIFAPLSEVPIVGRNWVYMPTLLLFVILQVPTALVNNIGGLVILRFLAGLIAAPPLANGAASVAMGPFLGAIFTQVLNWRYAIWLLTWMAAITFLLLLFLFPETNHDTILSRRARRLRIATGDARYTTRSEKEYESYSTKEFIKDSLVRPIAIGFFEPMIFLVNSYTALVYAVFYSFFESFPLIFSGVYGFNLIEIGLSYLPIMIGIGLGYFVYAAAVRIYLIPRLKADSSPETVFNIAFFAALVLPPSVLLIGWSSTKNVHWIVPMIGIALFNASGYQIFQTVFTYLGMSYPRFLASTFAGNDLLRSTFAAAFPLFSRAMFVNLGSEKFPVGWGNTLLAGLLAVMILIPVLLLKLGEKMRAVSKYAN